MDIVPDYLDATIKTKKKKLGRLQIKTKHIQKEIEKLKIKADAFRRRLMNQAVQDDDKHELDHTIHNTNK